MEEFHDTFPNGIAVRGKITTDSKTIILILPALGSPAKLYTHFFNGISKRGISVAVMNLRGDGLLEKDQLVSEGNFGYVELLEDIDTVIHSLIRRYPGRKIVTMGHSLGGQLGCLYQCHDNSKTSASIVIAGGSVGYQSWKGVDKLKTYTATQLFGLIAKLLGWFPGKRIGFGGNQPKNVMIDWSRNARTGMYQLINEKIKYEAKSRIVTSLFLGIVIENDYFAPYAAAKSLFEKFPLSDSQIFIINKNRFNKIVPNHFRWLKEPDPVIDVMVLWLEKKGLNR